MLLSRRAALITLLSPYLRPFPSELSSTTPGDDASREQDVGPTRVLNVRQYGATGDGVHDDTTAFTKGIDAASQGAGAILYVPAGRYLLAPITSSPHTVRIVGDGPASALVSKGSTPVLEFNKAENVVLEDLAIVGQKGSQVGDFALLAAIGCTAIAFTNVTIRSSGGDGAHLVGAQRIQVQGSSFEDCGRFGLRVTDTPTLGYGRQIVRCLARGNGAHGILLQRFAGADVESNLVVENRSQGIHATDGSDWLRVFNNRCTKNGSQPIEHGIYILRCRGVAVQGNTSFANAGDGILLRECNDSVVVGNICTDNHRHGISIQRIDDPKSDALVAAANVGARNTESGVIATGVSRSIIGMNVAVDNGRFGVGGYPGPTGGVTLLALSCNLLSDNSKAGIAIAGSDSAAAVGNVVRTSGDAPALSVHDFETHHVAQVRVAGNVEVSTQSPSVTRDLKGAANLLDHISSDAPIH